MHEKIIKGRMQTIGIVGIVGDGLKVFEGHLLSLWILQ